VQWFESFIDEQNIIEWKTWRDLDNQEIEIIGLQVVETLYSLSSGFTQEHKDYPRWNAKIS
jgi:hypothetical protein